MMPPSEAQGQAEEAAAEAAAQAGGPGAPVSPKKAADRPDLAKVMTQQGRAGQRRPGCGSRGCSFLFSSSLS